ncbi:MAG: Ig-like domain-containing protein [Clostridia bacterium]
MKKILIGLLVLIPLMIVGAVMLATEVISLSPDIGVIGVEINGDREVSVSGIKNHKIQVTAKVYPKKAKNDKIYWSIENVSKFDPDYTGDAIATIDDKGNVKIYSYGIFYVVATTDDGGHTDKCMYIVKGEIAENAFIVINGENAESCEMTTDKKLALGVKARPTDAPILYSMWESDDPSIVSVDNNGILTAKKAGQVVITVKIKSPDSCIINEKGEVKVVEVAKEITSKIKVTSSEGNFKFDSYYTTSSSVNLSEFANGTNCSIISDSDAVIVGNVLNFNSAKAVIVKRGNTEIVVGRCESDDLIFENAELMEKNIKINRLPTSLNCAYRATGKGEINNVVYSSSNTNIAEINSSGLINAKEDGDVVFTATVGGKSINIAFKVVTPVTYIVLSDSGADEKRGIARECIYGNMYYNKQGEIVFTRKMEVKKPVGQSPLDFIWESNRSDITSIDENGIITFAPIISGIQNVSITVKSKNTAYSADTVSAVYNFKVAQGINVFDKFEIVNAANTRKIDIFVQKDIHFYNEEGRGIFINLYTNLFGNGRMIDYTNIDPEDNLGGYIISIRDSNVKLRNLTVRAAQPPDDDNLVISKATYHGNCVEIFPNDGQRCDIFKNIKVEYCLLEYAKWAFVSYGGEVSFEGCVMRNTSNYNLYVDISRRDYQDCNEKGEPIGQPYQYSSNSSVTIKNCIFAKSLVTCLGFNSSDAGLDGFSYLKVEGFMEIYNWQYLVDLDLIGTITGNPVLDNAIKGAVTKEMQKPKYDEYTMTVGGLEYFSLGIMLAGALYPSNTIVSGNIEGNGFVMVEIGIADLIGQGDFPACQAYTYKNNSKLTPTSTYTLDEKTCARLRGEAN